MIWTVAFWKGAGERAVKTFFQTVGALLVVAAGTQSVGDATVPAVGIEGIKWAGILSVAATAAVLSLVTSIGNAQFTAGAAAEPDHSPVRAE